MPSLIIAFLSDMRHAILAETSNVNYGLIVCGKVSLKQLMPCSISA